jgi:signal transduction histidine kinase
MARLSEIIENIYQKYFPIVKKLGVSLDIDFPDTTLTIHEKERVEKDLDKSMRSAVKRSRKGRISIIVRPGKIVVQDDGTILSKTTCKLLSTEHISVKSRVGFGTTVTIRQD